MYSVYIHVFPNQKVYIGITRQSVEDRWKSGRNYAKCTSVYRAIQKYGWDNIKHEVVKVVETKEEAERLEKLFIFKYGSNDPRFGYNLTSGGNAKYCLSQESKEKISKKNKDRWENDVKRKTDASERMAKRMEDQCYKQKILLALKNSNNGRKPKEKGKIVQLSKDGVFIKAWGRACDIERAGIADAHNVGKCCRKVPQYKTAGGYVWVYESEYLGGFTDINIT